MKPVALLSGILTIIPALTQAGTPLLPEARRGTVSLHLDNDLYVGTDRDYTNGARLSWISAPLASSGFCSLSVLPGILAGPEAENAEEVRHHYGFSLTQLIFTPENYLALHQPQGERRYAGWLGLGFSLHAQNIHVLNSLELALGTTGPNSLAETTQDAVHEMRKTDKFNGWDEQIPNEITADMSFVQKLRKDFDFINHGDSSMDGTFEWGARLGTFRTAAHLGVTLRGGFHLTPDFSDFRLSEIAFSHRNLHADGSKSSEVSAYLLGGAVIRGIAHDATLDGPLFRDFQTGNTRKPFVTEAFFGIGMAYRGMELSYVQTWRSKEYEEQNGASEFGSVGIRFRF